jgi:hypothetical protein
LGRARSVAGAIHSGMTSCADAFAANTSIQTPTVFSN